MRPAGALLRAALQSSPVKKSNHRLPVENFVRSNQMAEFLLREPSRLDPLIFHWLRFTLGQLRREEYRHLLFNVTRTGEERHQLLPLLRAQAGLFDQLAL